MKNIIRMKKKDNEEKSVIHRYITDNEHKTYRDTFDKVIKECTNKTYPVDME